MGSRSVIGSGVVPNTPYFMEQWLLDPDKIKPGVHMPNFQLSTPQARDLTAYLESLQ
jgi:cytochrome c oxidase subunit 2